MSEGKYYWLKLKRDFFKRHDIRIIESMPNGKDYILFYLKLLLESIDHEGKLRFSDTIPYNEQMLSVITNTNIDVVRSAMDVFKELNMIEIFDDQTIYMAEVDKLIGSETKWAEKKRIQRAKEDNVPRLSPKCPTELEKEKEKETETDIEQDVDVETDTDNTFELMGGTLGKNVILLTPAQHEELLDKLGLDAYNHYVDKLSTFIIEKGAKVANHYATILKWAREDAMI